MIDIEEKRKMMEGKTAEELVAMTEMYYCPYCGVAITDDDIYFDNSDTCQYCRSPKDYKKASHNLDYYLEKGGDWDTTIINEENVRQNPLWSDECEKRKYVISGRQIDYALELSRDKDKPKCPTCQSVNIRKISALNRGASVALFGLFSSKIGKSFECNNCGYKW